MELDITVVDNDEKSLDEIKDEFKVQVNNNFHLIVVIKKKVKFKQNCYIVHICQFVQ